MKIWHQGNWIYTYTNIKLSAPTLNLKKKINYKLEPCYKNMPQEDTL